MHVGIASKLKLKTTRKTRKTPENCHDSMIQSMTDHESHNGDPRQQTVVPGVGHDQINLEGAGLASILCNLSEQCCDRTLRFEAGKPKTLSLAKEDHVDNSLMQ